MRLWVIGLGLTFAAAGCDLFDMAEPVATVKDAGGDVTIKGDKDDAWENAVLAQGLFVGDVVTTGDDGHVTIEFAGGNVVELDPNASLLIEKDGGAGAGIGTILLSGSARARSSQLGFKLMVGTPTGLTSIVDGETDLEITADGDLRGVLAYNDEPLVSIDFNHDPAWSTYEAPLTKVIDGRLVKVCSWYDNEWGFSNRMLDTTIALMNAG